MFPVFRSEQNNKSDVSLLFGGSFGWPSTQPDKARPFPKTDLRVNCKCVNCLNETKAVCQFSMQTRICVINNDTRDRPSAFKSLDSFCWSPCAFNNEEPHSKLPFERVFFGDSSLVFALSESSHGTGFQQRVRLKLKWTLAFLSRPLSPSRRSF